MESLKFIALIKSFSVKQLEDFQKFLISPYFVTGRNYNTSFIKIYEFAKRKKFVNITLKEIYSVLYPNTVYKYQTINNRLSELFKLGEKFLLVEFNDKNPVLSEKKLLEHYIESKSYSFFEKRSKKTFKLISNDFSDNDNLLLISMLHLLNSKKYIEQSDLKKFLKEFNMYSHFFVNYYLIKLSEIGIEYLLQEYRNVKHPFNLPLTVIENLNIEAIAAKIEKENKKKDRLVLANLYLLLAYLQIEKPDGGFYFKSKKYFLELYDSLSQSQIKELYSSMSYYCVLKQNRGELKFRNELFEIYNDKLQRGFYSDLTQNVFSVNIFRDYVYIGLMLNKLEWTEKFISEYAAKLPPEVREGTVSISFSKILFIKNDFAGSLKLIREIKAKNYLDFLDISTLKLKNFFELEEYEDSYQVLEHLSKYLKRHEEIPKDFIHFTNGFIKYYKLLLKIKTEPDNNSEIENAEFILKSKKFRNVDDWLTGKLRELVNTDANY